MNLPRSFRITAAAMALSALCRCTTEAPGPPKERPAAPAQVENRGIQEADLARIVLTPKAEERLGIQTETVEFGPAARSVTLPGEVVLPPGQSLIVTAPVAGTLEVAAAGGLKPGATVSGGQPLFRLLPLVAAQRDLRVTAEAELASARTRLDTARVRTGRAEQMLKDRVGSERALEDARQEQALAETAVRTAEARLEQLKLAPLDADVAMTIASPLAGMVRQIYAAEGQQVAAGASLVEVLRLDPVWIRVPVYAGRLDALLAGAGARIAPLNESGGRAARPVPAPPTADPLSATADLYFELPNDNLALRPGEKVNATLPLRGREKVLMAPAAAVLYDMNGGTWLYEKTAPQTFVRRRIEVAEIQGAKAVLRIGPAPGTSVVTAGAAELFGTEFGAGK